MFMMILWDLGNFSYFSPVFSKMDMKNNFFDFLHMVYYRNPEIQCKQPISIFFVSEVI